MTVTAARAAEIREHRSASMKPVVVQPVRRGTRIRVGAGTMTAVLLVAACGTHPSTSASSTASASSTSTTVDNYAQNKAQAARLCDQAFAAAPSPAQNPGRPPLTSFEKDDTSGLQGGTISTGMPWPDWTALPGLVEIGAPAASDLSGLNTIVCVRGSYEIVGDYVDNTGAKSPAARVDYDARLVDWGTGAVLAAQHFQGSDPQQDTVTTHPGSVLGGDPPTQALVAWVKGLVPG